MRIAAIFGVLMMLLGREVAAQAPSTCELRVGSGAVGGALSLPLAEATLNYGNPRDGLWTEVLTRGGRGWSAEVGVPIMPGWGARVDFTRSRLAAERRTVATPVYDVPERRREGSVGVRHLTVSLVHAVSPPRLLCAYMGGGGGLYEFEYAGQRARNRGLFGVGGVEFPVGERSGLALEIQLHAAHNNSEGPLLAEVVLMLKPTMAFRVRF